MKKFFEFIWETLKIVVFSLIIILPIRYYVMQPFFVQGASMEPNFYNGDYLIVDELTYHFREPKRGDVVVFKYPKDPSQYYIKRIIGLPNETIEIKNNRVIIYNQDFPFGLVLDESNYLKDGQITQGNVKISLKEDEYFVLGDNRKASYDSRQWGVLPRRYIVGRALLRAWPLERITVFVNSLNLLLK